MRTLSCWAIGLMMLGVGCGPTVEQAEVTPAQEVVGQSSQGLRTDVAVLRWAAKGPNKNCRFGDTTLGHQAPTNDRASGRLEETVILSGMTNRRIVSLKITHNTSTLQYSDMLLLAYNDSLLMASDSRAASHSAGTSTPPTTPVSYVWSNILNKSISSPNTQPPWCTPGATTCSVPRSEVPGALTIDLPNFKSLDEAAYPSAPDFRTFRLVTLGDNDDGTFNSGSQTQDLDCTHGALELTLTIVSELAPTACPASEIDQPLTTQPDTTTAYYNGHAYRFRSMTRDWASAQADCASIGYDLVTVNDASEQAWLDERMDAIASNEYWWNGANDQSVEGAWGWASGGAFTYANWAPGEPNNGGTANNEDCALMNYAFQSYGTHWNDAPCNAVAYYICESRTTTPPSTTTAYYNGHAYKFKPIASDWASAQADCASIGYDLVTVNDASEQAWLDERMDSIASNQYWWNGANDQSAERSWGWTSGESYSYANWAPGEPNNSGTPTGNEDCALMNYAAASYGTHWNDAPCNAIAYYICESRTTVLPAPLTYNGRTYLFVTRPRDQAAADEDCACRGYKLVTVNDSTEQAWLNEKMDYFDSRRYWWNGASDLSVEGAWGWASGESFSYASWAPGEPNNGGATSNEDCTQMNYAFQSYGTHWNDTSCFDRIYYICEK